MLNKISVLNVSITCEEKEKILEYLYAQLNNVNKKTFIITPNPEMLVYASKHLAYQSKLNHANIALPDGVGLFFASGLMGTPLRERITGVDFMEELCKASREKPLSMGFLGGKGRVAELTAERLQKKYPWLNIVFAGSKWNGEDSTLKEKQHQAKSNKITSTKGIPRGTTIDILFVAYGVPKQEEWIYEHLDKLPVKAAMGVGGSFDFLSGKVRRAPFIIRFFGFEWLFRLFVQPWRWKRQLALITFMRLVFKEYLSKK